MVKALSESMLIFTLANEAFERAQAAFARGDVDEHRRWNKIHAGLTADHAVLLRDLSDASLH
jgi:hypothetical protein